MFSIRCATVIVRVPPDVHAHFSQFCHVVAAFNWGNEPLLRGFFRTEMELSQIKYFVVLARTLHFTKAAETCNVSQPALTRAIQKLEEELGGALFVRERSHTQLTDLGRAMVAPLERALASAQDARAQAAAFRRRETSPLRVGLEYSVPPSVLTPAMTALRRRSQDIELTLRQGSQTDLCKRMLGGELDLALLVEGRELHERLHRWRMFAERYVLIGPPDHPFR
jgi:DNA-binding transcriptional LysR family regulator